MSNKRGFVKTISDYLVWLFFNGLFVAPLVLSAIYGWPWAHNIFVFGIWLHLAVTLFATALLAGMYFSIALKNRWMDETKHAEGSEQAFKNKFPLTEQFIKLKDVMADHSSVPLWLDTCAIEIPFIVLIAAQGFTALALIRLFDSILGTFVSSSRKGNAKTEPSNTTVSPEGAIITK